MIINFTNFKPWCPVVQSTTRLDAFAFQSLIMKMVFFFVGGGVSSKGLIGLH